MKKILLLSVASCAILAPLSMFGQSKKTSAKTTKAIPVSISTPIIRTVNDSISYVLGQQMTQGLPQYLVQLGVLGDTLLVNNDYQVKIATADVPTKAKLEKEMKQKIDSINTANAINKKIFIEGLNDALSADVAESAYYAGVGVATQIKGMMSNASQQILGDADALNKNIFIYAFNTSLIDGKPLIVVEDGQAYIQAKQNEITQIKEQQKAEEMMGKYADKIAEGKAFFEANKSNPGVVQTTSGLQYKIEIEGHGVKPKMGEQVTVNYRGTLLDGTVFDSSYDRGEPATFSVGQLIKGFNEALELMPAGSKWTVYIPYYLAYGASDKGVIKPFSDLIFEIELIKVGE